MPLPLSNKPDVMKTWLSSNGWRPLNGRRISKCGLWTRIRSLTTLSKPPTLHGEQLALALHGEQLALALQRQHHSPVQEA